MSPATGLLKKCIIVMIPEPLQFTQVPDGGWQLEVKPFKTIIDVHALRFIWIKPNESRGIVEIMLNGETVIYDRIAVDPHGHWICSLRIGTDHGDEREPD